MTNKSTRKPSISARRRAAIAVMGTLMLLGGYGPQVWATPEPIVISQRQGDWDAVLKTARVLNNAGNVTALAMQLDVLDKPVTSYANAVYQIYARQSGQWRVIYSSLGARLIASPDGRLTLPPEVVSLRDLEDALDEQVNWNNLELRSVVQVRYDVRGGQRNQEVQWQQVESYREIAQTTTTYIEDGQIVAIQPVVASSTNTSTSRVTTSRSTTSTAQVSDARDPWSEVGGTRENLNVHRGHFSLGVLQSRATYTDVIARVSVMSKRPDWFLEERFIGDFRYRPNQRAQFIRGLDQGDRIVVRLFDLQNNLIGYSEFELLSDFAAVNLILPSQTTEERLVRTVYGIDANRNGEIDSGSTIYDYFTRLSGSSYRESRVTFLPSTQGINTSLFTVRGLPSPATTCRYTNSFLTGNFSLVSRTRSVFRSALAPALIAVPGEVTEITTITSTSIYEVSRLILIHEEVGVSDGTVVIIREDGDFEYDDDDYGYDDDDDDDYGYNDDDDDYGYDYGDDDDDRPRRRNCNQGIGNGAEGCDPGNSRPHGGSNDEGGRTPGGRRR